MGLVELYLQENGQSLSYRRVGPAVSYFLGGSVSDCLISIRKNNQSVRASDIMFLPYKPCFLTLSVPCGGRTFPARKGILDWAHHPAPSSVPGAKISYSARPPAALSPRPPLFHPFGIPAASSNPTFLRKSCARIFPLLPWS